MAVKGISTSQKSISNEMIASLIMFKMKKH